MLNKNASTLEQAVQAVQLKNDFMVTARNAMDDANAAAQLSMTTPARTFDEMLRARSKEYAGDALYRQVIADAKTELQSLRKVSQPGACFVAGTLVHTKDGLKPIETIKVGDWVLAQPEGQGERSYKRVLRTFEFADKEVWSVTYYSKAERDQARAENRMMREDCTYRLVVTPNHPFWVAGKGWTQASDLQYGDEEFELCDGERAIVCDSFPLYRTEEEGMAWREGPFDPDDGDRIDLRDGKSLESTFPRVRSFQPGFVERGNDSSLYRCSVYNMEVEGDHTYYVGTQGVWVHNTNCGENLGGRATAIADGLIPPQGLGLYFTEGQARQLAGANRGVILVQEKVSNPQ